MKPAIFHPEAEEELEAAVGYYENQRTGLGLEFQAEVEKAVSQIQRNPRMFSLYKDRGFRRCLVRRFPYTLFFLELDDAIWIAAVAHQKRRPDYWASRSTED